MAKSIKSVMIIFGLMAPFMSSCAEPNMNCIFPGFASDSLIPIGLSFEAIGVFNYNNFLKNLTVCDGISIWRIFKYQ